MVVELSMNASVILLPCNSCSGLLSDRERIFFSSAGNSIVICTSFINI